MGKVQNKSQPRKIKNYKPVFTFGLGKERDYFVENLSMLISGGMPITGALDSIAQEMRLRRMKRIIADIKLDIEAGSPLWKTLGNSKLFPTHAVSLIRLGEESGKLMQNLKMVATEQEKDRSLKSKLRSAMMYPLFVMSLTVIIGVGIAWFILPKLATVFSQLKIKLPLITKILIGAGTFLGEHGYYVVPLGITLMAVLFFFLFSFSKTKFIGQFILFMTPGINGLIKEIELARFGYLLGTLLEAGLPITRALDSLASASEVSQYKKLYIHLRDSVGDGNSIKKSFASFKRTNRLIPTPIQQLIVASEQSGTLSRTLLKIGQTFEAKADTSTKNLTIILEPILLVVVWLGVVAVALAVILPIYSLIGGFNSGQGNIESAPPAQEAQAVPAEIPIENSTTMPEAAIKTSPRLEITQTGLGYLNVRAEPTTVGDIVGRVLPGESYEYSNEQDGWYEIFFGDNQQGWVSSKYVKIITVQ